MANLDVLILVIGALLVLLTIGVPVAFALGSVGAAILYFMFGGATGLQQVAHVTFRTLETFELTAVPLFIMMGVILLKAGVGRDLFNVAEKWLNWLPGGLYTPTIGACAIFAAISGSSVATATTIGTVALPEMERRNYPTKRAVGVIAAAGTLGILIPPSIPMILYGTVTGESVGRLFMAGVIPGILSAALYIVYVAVFVTRGKKEYVRQKFTWRERFEVLRGSFWGLLSIPIVLGGIYSGYFTPTEAAAVGMLWALCVGCFIMRTLNLKALADIFWESAKMTSMIFFIVAGAMVFGQAITMMQVPQYLVEVVGASSISKLGIILLFSLMFFIMGMFLDPGSVILITMPVIYPILLHVGIDPIWFGILLTKNMEVGNITPPVGLNLYVIKGLRPDLDTGTIISGVGPYILVDLFTLGILIAFPALALYLPSTMFSR